jgi:hypothetical protein
VSCWWQSANAAAGHFPKKAKGRIGLLDSGWNGSAGDQEPLCFHVAGVLAYLKMDTQDRPGKH